MLHPNDLYTLARRRQDALIASSCTEQIRAPHRSPASRGLPQLRAMWAWLAARALTRRHPARPAQG